MTDAPSSPVPLIAIFAPTMADAGVKPVISGNGDGVTVNGAADVAVAVKMREK